ncbi:MAG: fimbria/pilus outer membrane usher protein [Dongiaceae bacterium]
MILEIRVNGALADPGGMVRVLPDGAVLAPVEDANRWRLRFDQSQLVDSAGERFLPLASVPGLKLELDEPRSLLTLSADPSTLTTTALAIGSGPAPQPNELGPGGFLNYDVLVQQSTVATNNGAQLRLGLFDGFGVLTSEHSFSSGSNDVALRLVTTLRKDLPASLNTLRLGDFSSAPGTIGQAALIGGVQWGTNFGLQPSLVTFPFQTLTGEATLPSTVDVYLNGALRSSVNAPPGPFEIAQIPVITGQGMLQMVVTDALGRSVLVEQPFFASAHLLQAGLHEQSWELGALREDFGIASNRYGRMAAITTHRWGLDDRLTAELRAEALSEQQLLGAGVAVLAGRHGIVLANFAYGGDQDARGGRATLGYQGQWNAFSLGAELRATEAAFKQVGDGTTPAAPPSSTAALTLGWSSERVGSFGLALVNEVSRTGSDAKVVNLSWSSEVGADGHLALSYFEDFAVAGRRGAALTYTHAVGDHTSASLTMNDDDGDSPRAVAQAQHSLDRDPGWGWRMRADDQGDGSAELALQTDNGIYRVGGDKAGSDTRGFANATGGLVWFSGSMLPARRIESAFGLVRVPGMAGVRVYFENDLFGVTDKDGELLLPTLRPYQANEVRIEIEDLPFDAVVATDRMSGVPYFGSGVVFEFPARIERSVTLTLLQRDGRPVPAGARLRVAEGPAVPVGEAGFAFVALPEVHNRLVASWSNGACSAELELPASHEALPDLGRILCQPPATPDTR